MTTPSSSSATTTTLSSSSLKSFIEFGKKGNVFGFAVMKMDAQPQSIAERNPMRMMMMMIRIVMIVKTTIFMLGKGSKPPVTEKLR